jgi:hypothetical protein
MKSLLESIRTMYTREATMMQDDGKVVHNCAKHVEHAEFGNGATIAEEHADPDRYGNIAWYDVQFAHGVEKGVPISELKIVQSESHMHSTKKAKKVSEGLNVNAPVSIDPKQAIKKQAMDAALAAANQQATGAGEIDKIVHQGVTKEEKEDKEEALEDDDVKAAGHKKTKERYETMSSMAKRMKEEKMQPQDEKDKVVAGVTGAMRKSQSLVQQGKTQRAMARNVAKSKYDMNKEDIDFPILQDHDQSLPESVDETIITAVKEYDIAEAQKSSGYDAHFRAMMTKHGVKHPGELDTPEKKKAFFNKVDASYKAKNEDVFLEAMMASDLQKIKDAHKNAGNRISDEKSGSKAGQAHHSFVVTQPSGKRTRHIYHGSTKKVETMSPAPRSKDSSEQDLDDK